MRIEVIGANNYPIQIGWTPDWIEQLFKWQAFGGSVWFKYSSVTNNQYMHGPNNDIIPTPERPSKLN